MPMSDSVRCTTYVTDSVPSGCAAQRAATTADRIVADRGLYAPVPTSVRRTTPKSSSAAARWIARFAA